MGFDVAGVVREYGLLRECIFELLDGAGLAVSLAEFRERAVVGVQSAAGYEEGRPLQQSW
jgi:hypothetical protein